jgi:hypothetical protein
MHPALMFRRLHLVLVIAGIALAACKQEEGGVCQTNADCDDGLTCNAGTKRCQDPRAVTLDAGFPDAVPADARVPDAGAPEPDADPG